MRGGGPLLAGLFNIIALSALFIGNIGWKCSSNDATNKFMSDAPSTYTVDDDDGVTLSKRNSAMKMASPEARHVDLTPSYLQWDASKVEEPEDWEFQVTQSLICNKTTVSQQYDPTQKIIVHYHMQHNAGTEFFFFAKAYTPCATRACWQDAKHCMISNNEEIEAENLRQNYKKYGVQYVSYEMMLPPRFPLPFVSETARKGLFFTTIVRDPFKRFLTYYRRHDYHKNKGARGSNHAFFLDFHKSQGPYAGDNLNARWLSGALNDPVSRDHVNIAKCRLQLFDLVIADKLFDHAVKKVMCPLNNWKGGRFCNDEISEKEHKSKPDPLKNGTDSILIGGYIERLRPSFEIYDYARILSWKQLKEKGVKDLPELSEMPSHLDTLLRYKKVKLKDNEKKAYYNKIKRVSLENIEHFEPPVEFCNEMKQVWTSNPDEIPNAWGIGTIKNGFHPRVGKGGSTGNVAGHSEDDIKG